MTERKDEMHHDEISFLEKNAPDEIYAQLFVEGDGESTNVLVKKAYTAIETDCPETPDVFVYVREDIIRKDLSPPAPDDVAFKALDKLYTSEGGEDLATEYNIVKAAIRAASTPSADTIAVPREVVQGVRDAITDGERFLVVTNPEHLKQIKKNTVALASLDAVLAEGK